MDKGYLCVGHCCHDEVDGQILLGGTVSYAALLAKKWGQEVSIVTSVGPDFKFYSHFDKREIELINCPSAATTTFRNTYKDEIRTQRIISRADPIILDFTKTQWHHYPIIHLGPIADELDPRSFSFPKNSLVGLSIQGLLRRWDTDGIILEKSIDVSLLSAIDIIFLSEEDILNLPLLLNDLKKYCSHIVLTLGEKGAKVYNGGQSIFVPAIKSRVFDPTGAGDTFATAYLLEYNVTKDIEKACMFAHSAASFIIEHEGITFIPTLQEVRSRII